MNLLQSKLGEIKTIDEWKAECNQFYANLHISPSDQWERYQLILELWPVGSNRLWSGRKPVGKLAEGRASHESND